MPDEHAPTFEQRLAALTSVIELQNAGFNSRMDRLEQRHEALTQSIELLTADVSALGTKIGSIADITRETAATMQMLPGVILKHEERLAKVESKL
jgi:prefoldin subunit 5